jgi:hypothetical protein
MVRYRLGPPRQLALARMGEQRIEQHDGALAALLRPPRGEHAVERIAPVAQLLWVVGIGRHGRAELVSWFHDLTRALSRFGTGSCTR